MYVCAWQGASLNALNCNVTTIAFCTAPENVASFPAMGPLEKLCCWDIWCWGDLAVLYSWSMEHVWLLCRQNASLWELPPEARVFHGWEPCGTCSYCCVWREHVYRLQPQGVSSPTGISAWAGGSDLARMNGATGCCWEGSTTQRVSQDVAALLSCCTLYLVMQHMQGCAVTVSCHTCELEADAGELCIPGWALPWAPLAARKDARRHLWPLQPHNFWLKQNKEQRELLEGVCTSKRIIRLWPQGGNSLDCNCLPALMMARYFPKPFNKSNWAHLSQSSDLVLGSLPVPFGILCGGRSNCFSFCCWLISSCGCLMYKWAFEFGSMNPAVLPKSTNEAVTMAILFCCCSDKPSMWKTLSLTSLKGKAELSLLWELKAAGRKESRKASGHCLAVAAECPG